MTLLSADLSSRKARGVLESSRASSQIPSFPGKFHSRGIVLNLLTSSQTLFRIELFFDKDFNDFHGGLGMPFGSQNRFQIRQNPSSEIINFLTLILHAFLVPSGSNNDVFASGCLCGLDIFHSFEPCSAFLPKKLPTSDPKGSQVGAQSAQKLVTKTIEF